MDEDDIIYEKLISENIEKNYQVKLMINTFRGVNYLSIRKYFLSFDEGFVPSKEGISIPFEMTSSFTLLDGLVDICSDAESMQAVQNAINKSTVDSNQPK